MNDFPLDPFILMAISAISVIQSLFGVGVLLFGTPILLIYGYSFSELLAILLPISMGISLSQIIANHRHIDIRFFTRVILYTIPPIILFLTVALTMKKSFGLLIGVMLFVYAIRSIIKPLNDFLEGLARYERIWLLATGVIHGLTNLGGSMLTIIVSQKNHEKEAARATIAASYFTFALFQLLTLLLTNRKVGFEVVANAPYVLIGATAYLLTNSLIYKRLSNQAYGKAFSFLLFCSGIIVTYRSL